LFSFHCFAPRRFRPDRLSTPEVIADPYPAYRELRDRSPVNYVFIPAGALPGVEEPIRAWALVWRPHKRPADFCTAN